MEQENGGYFKGNVEARLDRVEADIKTVLENHLPHIQDSITNLSLDIERRQEKMNKWLIGILVSTIFVLLSIAANLIQNIINNK